MSKSTFLALVVFAVGLLAFLALVTEGPRLLSFGEAAFVPTKTVATQLEVEPGTWIAYEELPLSVH